MKVSVIAVSELDAPLITAWGQLQASDDALRSPYYRPEFTQLVASSGHPVRVAVIESMGKPAGFFPHGMDRWGQLRPVGASLNDYHGIIAQQGLVMDAGALLKACGATYFGFNHMPLTQATFAPYVRLHSISPVLDLQGGWEAYVQRLAVAQNTRVPGILNTVKTSSKRLERDLGPLRFEMDERNPAVLETLMRLKSEQWVRTAGAGHDAFAIPWIKRLLLTGLETRGDDFRGILSALYAGDKLVSAHFGIQTRSTLHYWFPVYDQAHAYYKPGLILLQKMAEQAPGLGLSLIDLGRGTQDYKMRFKTRAIDLGEGAVSRPSFVAPLFMAARTAKQQVRQATPVVRFRQWLAGARKSAPH